MENAIKELNGLGWFQMRTTLLVALPLTGFPGFMQMQVFFGQTLPHECENDFNKTGAIISKYTERNLSDCGDCSMQTSYANDFGLICDNKDSMPYLQSSFFVGALFGQVIWGILQDKIGRRKVLLICSTLVCLFGMIFVSSQNYTLVMIGAGFAGFFSVGLGQYTLPLEIVSADKRFIAGTLITAGWAIGAGWYLLSSFVFRDWRYAATMNLSLVLLCLPTYYSLIPESPRWLWRQGRKKEALQVLEWMARDNGRSFDAKMIDNLEHQEEEKLMMEEKMNQESLIDILKYPRVIFRFFVMLIMHCQTITIWLTMIFSADKMHCCLYITMLLNFILEGPIRITLSSQVLKVTRRKGMYLFVMVSCIFFIGALLIGDLGVENLDLLKLLLGVVGKFLLTMYFPIDGTYISELHPTIYRQFFSGVIQCIAALLSAFVPILHAKFPNFTYYMAIQTMIVVQLLLFMPATLRKTLPDTFQSASDFNKERGWKLTY